MYVEDKGWELKTGSCCCDLPNDTSMTSASVCEGKGVIEFFVKEVKVF